jgi:hypothetical protein
MGIPATPRTARLAGVVYLFMGVAALIGYYHAPLVHPDVETTARLITAAAGRFRVGVVADVLAAALAVPLAVLLHELFAPVGRREARLLAALLVAAVPVSFVVALDYVAAHWLLTGAPQAAGIAAPDQEALGMFFLRLHEQGVLAVEIFWGLWLLPFGTLILRSGMLPRALGVLLLVGGAAYVAHSLSSLLLGGPRVLLYERFTMVARGAAEFPVMLWLLLAGARAPPW